MSQQRFDSYPYLHASRRRCISHAMALLYVDGLDRRIDLEARKKLASRLGLSLRDCTELEDAWRNEQLRRSIVLKETAS